MPKTTKKITTRTKTDLTHALYNYVTTKNGDWVRIQATKSGVSYSRFMDNLIEFGRRQKFSPNNTGMKKAA